MFLKTTPKNNVYQKERFIRNSLAYKKQFGFQTTHRAEFAILQLMSQILDSFNECKFTVYLDLSKEFDAADHTGFLKKLKRCGDTGNDFKRFQRYLSNRELCIKSNNQNKNLKIFNLDLPKILR